MKAVYPKMKLTVPAIATGGTKLFGKELRMDLIADGIDPELVHQVLLNLVKNAIEASPRGGSVRVSVEPAEPGGVKIDVVDEGPGVPPAVQAEVFEPFMTTKKSGAGLGLYISHAIAARHGGRLEIAESSSAGTTFRLWLPGGAGAEGSAR